ncbi:hypothetical protein ACODT5_41195 [Streptomyces sp. 5.8]|uniref:hypothetical protein n=1 Tax=Streptomyces sp. 5.8 TaxID=3406571 RepID=UPI003BB56B6A
MNTRRPAGSTQWSTPQPVTGNGRTYGMTAPVYLPGGDLFVAGEPGWSRVRSAATGLWQSSVQGFAHHEKVRAVSAAATSGGTVTVTWREGYSYQEYTMAAVFKNGAWSAPRRLSTTGARFTGPPRMAADALGRPVALWDEYKLSETNSVVPNGVYQATTTSRALPKWRDHTDDGKADCSAGTAPGSRCTRATRRS